MLSAIILAAGRGTRMADLTQTVPKPLLLVDDESLIEHQIRRLKSSGVDSIIINTAWLGRQIESAIGDGRQYGVQINYSRETQGALETAGGIAKALDLITSDPFIAVNADVWINRPYSDMALFSALDTPSDCDAHLVLVDNPSWHPDGDFFLMPDKTIRDKLNEPTNITLQAQRLTFSGIGVYRKKLFEDLPRERYPLGPLLRRSMDQGGVVGEHFNDLWISVDTPQRLQTVRQWHRDSTDNCNSTGN